MSGARELGENLRTWKVDRMPRKCGICRHPERPDIEADLRGGLACSDIARRHHISKHALWRHWNNHVAQDSATAIATVTKVIAILDEAETSATWNISLLRVQEARRVLAAERAKVLDLLSAPRGRRLN